MPVGSSSDTSTPNPSANQTDLLQDEESWLEMVQAFRLGASKWHRQKWASKRWERILAFAITIWRALGWACHKLSQRASPQVTSMDPRQRTRLHMSVEACGAATRPSEPRASARTTFVAMLCSQAKKTFEGHRLHGLRRGMMNGKRQCWTLQRLWRDSGQPRTVSGRQASKPKEK